MATVLPPHRVACAPRLPSLVTVNQPPRGPRLADVHGAVYAAVLAADVDLAGRGVAIAVGSRGVHALPDIIRAVVEAVRARGGTPFVVPAMGSHGGATADGQRELLAALGVTESTLTAPIRATMATRPITEAFGQPVEMDEYAAGADALILVNRVKPHTDFRGPIGSGLLKMAAVGLGNHTGATRCHALFPRHGYAPVIIETGRAILSTGRIALGVALVENSRHETACVEAVPAAELEATERRLLTQASEWLATLPVDDIDVLVVDRFGKDISGAGMDPNVTGRHSIWSEPPFPAPRVRYIVVGDLTDASHGNAAGIGNADFITEAFAAKVDWTATWINSVTSGTPTGGRQPVTLPTLADAVQVAVGCVGLSDVDETRVVRIRSTSDLDTVDVSLPIWRQLQSAAA